MEKASLTTLPLDVLKRVILELEGFEPDAGARAQRALSETCKYLRDVVLRNSELWHQRCLRALGGACNQPRARVRWDEDDYHHLRAMTRLLGPSMRRLDEVAPTSLRGGALWRTSPHWDDDDDVRLFVCTHEGGAEVTVNEVFANCVRDDDAGSLDERTLEYATLVSLTPRNGCLCRHIKEGRFAVIRWSSPDRSKEEAGAGVLSSSPQALEFERFQQLSTSPPTSSLLRRRSRGTSSRCDDSRERSISLERAVRMRSASDLVRGVVAETSQLLGAIEDARHGMWFSYRALEPRRHMGWQRDPECRNILYFSTLSCGEWISAARVASSRGNFREIRPFEGEYEDQTGLKLECNDKTTDRDVYEKLVNGIVWEAAASPLRGFSSSAMDNTDTPVTSGIDDAFFRYTRFDAYIKRAWESEDLVVGRDRTGQLANFGSSVSSMHACKIYGDDFGSSPLHRSWREGRLLLHPDDSVTVMEMPPKHERENVSVAGAPRCLMQSITYQVRFINYEFAMISYLP